MKIVFESQLNTYGKFPKRMEDLRSLSQDLKEQLVPLEGEHQPKVLQRRKNKKSELCFGHSSNKD